MWEQVQYLWDQDQEFCSTGVGAPAETGSVIQALVSDVYIMSGFLTECREIEMTFGLCHLKSLSFYLSCVNPACTFVGITHWLQSKLISSCELMSRKLLANTRMSYILNVCLAQPEKHYTSVLSKLKVQYSKQCSAVLYCLRDNILQAEGSAQSEHKLTVVRSHQALVRRKCHFRTTKRLDKKTWENVPHHIIMEAVEDQRISLSLSMSVSTDTLKVPVNATKQTIPEFWSKDTPNTADK